jgi:DNA-binding transcriptional ArsR family regulator
VRGLECHIGEDGAPKEAAKALRAAALGLSHLAMPIVDALKALGNDRRLLILDWLKDPRAHFPPQVDGDLVKDGVCALLLAEKLGITQATLSEHMRVLVQAELVLPKRIKQWTFYRRDEGRIRAVKADLIANL